MVSTMEIPFPTPLSVILSPIHIRMVDPAVNVVTTNNTLITLNLSRYSLLPKPIAIAIASTNARITLK